MNVSTSNLRRRIAGLARVLCYSTVLSLLGAALASRAVYANFTEASFQVGRELEALNAVLGSTKTLFVNGTVMNVSTAVIEETPGAVLDRFEAVCRSHPEFMAKALADIPATIQQRAKLDPGRAWRLGVVRNEAGGEGTLTCFTDDRPAGLGDVVGRMRAFARSQDLSEFGHFRYVYAVHGPEGTHVRTVWTDGEFNLGTMFPPHGDAAGFDPASVPRPPNARRIVSATSAQVPYGLHVYSATDSQGTLRRFYQGEMAARGWQPGEETHDTVAYLREGALTFVTLTAHGSGTLVTMAESGRSDTRSRADVHVEQ